MFVRENALSAVTSIPSHYKWRGGGEAEQEAEREERCPSKSRDGQAPARGQFPTRLKGIGVEQNELRSPAECHHPSWLLGDQKEETSRDHRNSLRQSKSLLNL